MIVGLFWLPARWPACLSDSQCRYDGRQHEGNIWSDWTHDVALAWTRWPAGLQELQDSGFLPAVLSLTTGTVAQHTRGFNQAAALFWSSLLLAYQFLLPPIISWFIDSLLEPKVLFGMSCNSSATSTAQFKTSNEMTKNQFWPENGLHSNIST